MVDEEGRPVAAIELIVPAEAYILKELLELAPKVALTTLRVAEDWRDKPQSR